MKFFSTDGIRGNALELISSNVVLRLGQIIGEKYQKVIVAYDTRISSKQILDFLLYGIVMQGCDVYIQGICPTPVLSYILKEQNFDLGVVITASHNPYFDNGIKLLNSNGDKISKEESEEISYLLKQERQFSLKDKIGKIFPCDYSQGYIDHINSSIDFENKLKVIIDCANGAFSYLINRIKLDNVKIINNQPNGVNINDNVGALYPENLMCHVQKNNYDYGFSFDGDGDRLIFANQKRSFDGDDILYNLTINANYSNVVITKMSNIGLIKEFEKKGIKYNFVDVGDANISLMMKEKKYPLGGEVSGHIIFYHNLYSDGLVTLIKILKILNENKLLEYKKYESFTFNINHSSKAYKHKENLIKEIENKISKNDYLLVRESGTEDVLRVSIQTLNINLIQMIDKLIKDKEGL